MTRASFLAPLIGSPWSWRGGNCWDFATHVQRELFGRELPPLEVPQDFNKRWVLDEFARNPERARWSEASEGPGGLVTAADGSLVMMAHLRFPAHIGVWLRPEGRVVHCDTKTGVACETPLALRQMGWKRLIFLEPKL